ncbi:MAG: hypothetical protein B6U76_10115 [Desulfurococcales archaeon ex4484_217_2]|nr:MAG: hypothetical protein B6U76_10115 [Desulfurococcales archaeon ex4484_217_2]
MAKIISLTHGKDLDGIASAAIVLRYASKIGKDFEVFFSEPQTLHDALTKLVHVLNKDVSEIVISDLGLNRRAELVQRSLLPDDAVAAKLALLARDADFWIFSNEISKKLSKIISYREVPLKNLVETLSKGTFWNNDLERKFKEVISKEKEVIDKCLETLETHIIKGFKVALVKGKIPAGEIAELLAKKGYDVIVVISPEGKVSLRRGNSRINLVPIAEKLNGGGHPFAAGGTLNYGWFDKFLAKNFGIYRKKEIVLKAISEVLP